MISFRTLVTAAAVTLLCVNRAGAQTAAAPATLVDSTTWGQWQAFLPGKWSCAGAFSSGRKLEADLTFTSVLSNRWIQYNHEDRAPGAFKTIGLWGIQSGTRRLISNMHDNGGGARRFNGMTAGDTLTFQLDRTFSNATSDERFVWQRESANLRMTWQVARTPGQWVTGDYLLCSRTAQ